MDVRRPTTHLCTLGLLGLLMALGGCGGGSGGGGGPATQQFIFGGEASRDGFVRSNATSHSDGGGPLTGDLDQSTNGLGFKQLFSFYIDLLPVDATVVSATLHIFHEGTQGTPYAKLGNVTVDHLFYDLLGPADYASTPLTANIGTLSTSSSRGYRVLDVTPYVQADIAAGRVRSQYRAQFQIGSNNDGVSDLVQFTDTENSATQKGGLPLLVVQYTTP